MQENNYEYLTKQLKYTGFGEDIALELRNQMQQNQPQFALQHQAEYGRDQAKSTLQFRKSEESGMYFFNSYSLEVDKGNGAEAVRQTFYINAKEDNVTLKEGYNLLQGRAIHKEFTPKEGEKYQGWMQLDFKDIDEKSNYIVKKFHENYGYDLSATLKGHPIMEMAEDDKRQRLIESLERGNRQAVGYIADGAEHRVYVEAAPQFKSLNFYDSNMKRLKPDQLEALGKETSQEQSQSKKQQQKPSEDDAPTKIKKATGKKAGIH